MKKFFRVPGSRTLFSLFLVLAVTLLTMGITVLADGEVVEETAVEGVEEVVEEVVEEEAADTPAAYGTFLSLLPPVIAIGLALITKEVYSSLFIGILSGGLLAAGFSPAGTMDQIVNNGFIAAVSGSAGIFIFLVLLGVLVALLNKTGASAAFGNWAKNNIKTRVGAALATFLLGVLIFIDDYFNCLTVGSVMLPVTDSHKISRAKLSYLIDATAAPVCMIAPISSWAAAVSDYAEGTGYDGLTLFIRAIPYNFYSLLTLGFIIMITLMKFDYGPMAIHEKNALEKGDLFTSGTEHAAVEMEKGSAKGKVMDLILPIVALILFSVIGLVYVGGMFDGASFVDAFANTDATVGLPWGSLIALVLTIIYLVCRKVISFKDALECVPEGFKAMVPAILILTFAWTLKSMTDSLGLKEYIAAVVEGFTGGMMSMLPAVIFIIACVMSFATGTSWGTFGILIPIVVAAFTEVGVGFKPGYETIGTILVSACMAGAVCGDHCSPISDTTIMASAGAQCNHLNHVQTQLPYAITCAVVSFVAYVFAGFVQNVIISLIFAFALMAVALVVIKALHNKKVKA